MAETTVWLSFDLGLRGDLEGMYAWLDSKKARECGDSMAFLKFATGSGLEKALHADLKKSVKLDRRSRIYAVWRDPKSGKTRGRFLVGGRKAPPWTGSAPGTSTDVDE